MLLRVLGVLRAHPYCVGLREACLSGFVYACSDFHAVWTSAAQHFYPSVGRLDSCPRKLCPTLSCGVLCWVSWPESRLAARWSVFSQSIQLLSHEGVGLSVESAYAGWSVVMVQLVHPGSVLEIWLDGHGVML